MLGESVVECLLGGVGVGGLGRTASAAVPIAVNDDGPGMGLDAAVTNHLFANERYFVQVEEFSGDAGRVGVLLTRLGE